MADDAERVDPKGTMETVPPPNGAKDAYSAQTRVATLPEHVLEAMRARETDASLEKRTKSGMRAAAVPAPPSPLAPPPLPSFASEAEISIPVIHMAIAPEQPAQRPVHGRGIVILRSIAIVAAFALLGALLAAALTHAAQ
jgi:hypothetical protein